MARDSGDGAHIQKAVLQGDDHDPLASVRQASYGPREQCNDLATSGVMRVVMVYSKLAGSVPSRRLPFASSCGNSRNGIRVGRPGRSTSLPTLKAIHFFDVP